MSKSLEDCVDELIIEGKTFKEIESIIFNKWHPHQQQYGYDLINKKLMAGDFKISRTEAKKLRPELFVNDWDWKGVDVCLQCGWPIDHDGHYQNCKD
jgi:hypothetical protein